MKCNTENQHNGRRIRGVWIAAIVGFVAAIGAGTLMPEAYALVGVDRNLPETVGDLGEPDSVAKGILDDGVTKAEYIDSIRRLRRCMGVEESDTRFSGPNDDLSGLRPLYTLGADTEDEMNSLLELHDECYERILLNVDIDYQFGVEDRVDDFYDKLNHCIDSSIKRDVAGVLTAVAAEDMSEHRLATLQPCLE